MSEYRNNPNSQIEYEEYVNEREERRRKRRMVIIRRRIVVGLIGLALICLLIFGIVKGIKAIANAFSKEPEIEVVQIEEVKATPEPTPTPKAVQMLAANEPSISKIHGYDVFEGYNIDTSEASYIGSEEMMSEYAALIDATEGKLIAGKEATVRINPASMTKIMTLLVAAEHISEEELDNLVEITSDDTYYAYKHDLSTAGFVVGEKVPVRELFYGTILPSGADAAIALARYVAGNEEDFVTLMNEKVAELGLSQTTHFTNCVGLFGDDHYSTCVDMAMILKATIENEYCYEVMNLHKYDLEKRPEHEDIVTLSNWFLRRIEDKETHGEVLCAKTGYVNQAGSCAASFYVSNEGKPYFCVTAKAHSAWRCIYDQVYIYENLIKHAK